MGVPAHTFTQTYYHLYGHNASPFLSKTVILSGIFSIPLPGTTKGPPAMPEALIFLRYFRESAYLLTVYQVSLPSTVEVVVQPAPRVILPVLALTGSTVVTPGL